MKTVRIIIILYVFSGSLSAQDLIGKYFNNSDYLEFVNDNVRLEICSDGCLIMKYCATGRYEILENYLLISTQKFNGEYSSIMTEKKAGDYSQFKISDKSGKSLPGVNIIYLNSLGKMLGGAIADEKGIARIENNKLITKIRVAFIGYDDFIIDFSDTLDYTIMLVDYKIIENQILVFKINSYNQNSLNLTLLTTNFQYKGDKFKALNRLNKKMKKYHFRERNFKYI